MRQGPNGRRPRGRPNRKQHGGPSRPNSYDSGGPEGRIRGNAHQVYEKYVGLARDAISAGDRVAAEAYYQHAEHYFRIVNASTDPVIAERRPPRSEGNGRDADTREPNATYSRDNASTSRESGHTSIRRRSRQGPARSQEAESASDGAERRERQADRSGNGEPSLGAADQDSVAGEAASGQQEATEITAPREKDQGSEPAGA